MPESTFALATNTQTESTVGFVCGPDLNGLVKLFPDIKRTIWGFPGGPVVKNLPSDAGDAGDAGLTLYGSGHFNFVSNLQLIIVFF